MKTVSLDLVIGLEKLLDRPNEDIALNNQLLLVYGSLAIKSTEEVEMHVINNLRGRVATLNDSDDSINLTATKILLHALGNTGSKLSIPLIMNVLNNSSEEDYDEVKRIAIDAFVKLTESPVVLVELGRILEEDSSADTVAAIIEMLHDGLAYVQQRNQNVAYYIDMLGAHALVYSLAETASSINSTDLHAMMEQYLQEIKADGEIFELLYGLVDIRSKRDTNNWNSSANSDFNYVNTLVNRQNDVNTYSRHTAYIASKTIGIDDANIKIAYGYFTGASTQGDRLKVYGRCIVVGKLLSHTSILADLKLDLQLNTTSASGVILVKIKSNTLVDYNYNEELSSQCLNYSANLFQFREKLHSLRFNLYIYIGYLTLRADLDVRFDLDVNSEVCIGRTGLTSRVVGALTPTVEVTVNGEVSASLLVSDYVRSMYVYNYKPL